MDERFLIKKYLLEKYKNAIIKSRGREIDIMKKQYPNLPFEEVSAVIEKRTEKDLEEFEQLLEEL